jgi:hypothetical protein
MMQTDNFKKIKTFVQQNIVTDNAVMIRAFSEEIKVNNYVIREEDGFWNVYNCTNDKVHQFFSRKYAVLAAVLMSKHRRMDIIILKDLDQQLNIASNDQIHYERMLQKICSVHSESIYVARLSKAKQILEYVRLQVRQLEKSLQLQ